MSPSYRFHPEFGYFCPTPSFRHRLRVALACVVVGGLAGVGVTLVLKAAHDPGTALTFARVDESSSSRDAISATDQAPSATTAERTRPPEGSKPACEDNTWANLDGKCVAGRTRKARTARPAINVAPIAALPLGSAALPPGRVGEPVVAAAIGLDRVPQDSATAPTPNPVSAAEAVATKPTVTKPSGRSAAAPKKPQKTARRHNGNRDQRVVHRVARARDNQLNGRVYASPDSRSYQRGPFDGGGSFSSGGPFGFVFR